MTMSQSLAQCMREESIDSDNALQVILSVVYELDKYHQVGLIHGNINPDTIMLSNDKSTVQLLPDNRYDMSQKDQQEKRLMYTAPEQIREEMGPILPATDCYSIGLIMYELLTQTPAITKAAMPEMRYAQVTVIPKSPHEIDGNINRKISDLVMNCIAKIPEDRPKSAQELVQLLKQFTKNHKHYPKLMIDRNYEVDQIWHLLNQQNRGVIWVHGESGCGKTHFVVEEIIKKWCKQWHVIQLNHELQTMKKKGHCLQQVCHQLSRDEFILFNWFDPADPQGAKANQLEKAREIIADYATKHPVIIFIDDSQWVNKQELEDVVSVVQTIDNAALIIISNQPAVDLGKQKIHPFNISTIKGVTF